MLFFLLTMGWIALIFYLFHFINFIASFEPEAFTPQIYLITGSVKAFLILIPLIILACKWPQLQFRIIFRAWALAACSIVLFLPIYFFNPISSQVHALIHFSGIWVLGVIVIMSSRKRQAIPADAYPLHPEDRQFVSSSLRYPGLQNGFLLVAFLCSFTLPWLASGALGSITDSLLQIAVGMSLGILGFFLLEMHIYEVLIFDTISVSLPKKYILLGLSNSTALLILGGATNFPFGSMQIILMVCLSSFGWFLAGMRLLHDNVTRHPNNSLRRSRLPRFNRSAWSLAFLTGAVATLPLILFDPDELGLFLGLAKREIFLVAVQTTAISILIIFLFTILVIIQMIRTKEENTIFARRWSESTRKKVYLCFAIGMFVAELLVYFQVGQPGFYGERLFVILKSQADLQVIDPQATSLERRQEIYDLLVQHAAQTQMDLRRHLDFFRLDYTSYYLVNAMEIPDSPILRLWLRTRPEVDRVLESPRLRPLPAPLEAAVSSTPETPPDYPPANIVQIHAERVWQEFDIQGQGILVGNADSGVQVDHPNFSERYRGFNGEDDYNWLDPWYNQASPVDPNGHGTHTLGTILGQYTGVAPKAHWIACANLPRNLGNPAFYLDCWQFLFAPYPQGGDPFTDGKPERGAQIINNSWGCPPVEGCDLNTFAFAAQALRLAGVFLAVSAGNEGPQCASIDTPPAVYPQVFSVGAIDDQGNLAFFSSLGPVIVEGRNLVKPDLVAPGVQVLSSYPGSTYRPQSGTSMAGPHVAGVVALIWSANPSLVGNIDRTEEILQKSAQPFKGVPPQCPGARDLPSTATGFGILDAYSAVVLALQTQE